MTYHRCPTPATAEHAAHVLSHSHPEAISTATGRILRTELPMATMRRALFRRVDIDHKEF